MIAKAKACVGGSKLIGYVVNEKKGYELERCNLSGENPTAGYPKSEPTLSKQYYFHRLGDGNKLTNNQWKQLTKGFLSSLGVNPEEAQYISFIHTEKEHKHVHIVLNRVKDDGKLIKDHYIGKRAQHIAHKLAKKMNLKSAKEIKEQEQKARKEALKDFRESFRVAHETVKKNYPKNITEYSEWLKQKGFTIIPTINRQGYVQGYKVDNGQSGPVKLSDIDRKIKLNENFFESLAHEKEKQEKYSRSFEQNIISQEKISYKLRR